MHWWRILTPSELARVRLARPRGRRGQRRQPRALPAASGGAPGPHGCSAQSQAPGARPSRPHRWQDAAVTFPAQETNIRAVFSSCSYQYRKTFGKCRKVSGRKEHTYCSPPGNNPCAFGRRTCGPFPSSACAREHVHMRACVRAGARAGRRACA